MTVSTAFAALRRRRGPALVGVLGASLLAAATFPADPASAASGSEEGIVCTAPSSASTGAETFALTARPGSITTPDGNSVYMWGYAAGGGGFQLPGPTLCVTEGDSVTVTLANTLPEPTSIVFAGQSVNADGAPDQPALDAAGHVSSLAKPAAAGASVTYTFTAGSPGSYLYTSGTDVSKQREMGLYGALVVAPKAVTLNRSQGGRFATGQADADPRTAYSGEYLYVLSSLDPDLHAAVEKNKPYDYTGSVARYFFINGRSMPDTLAPNNAAWMPAQPYGALVHIRANAKVPALIRYVNAGNTNYPFHPHGSSQQVVVRDGAPVVDNAVTGSPSASYLKFLVDVGPGQSIDTLERWQSDYDPGAATTAANPSGSCDPALPLTECQAIPSDVQLPQLQDQIVGPGTETWFSENPYLGQPANPNNPNGGQGDIPTGIIQNNQCGEYYHVAHSHALYQATNYGASFGGMMTLIRIDPPAGTCGQ